MLLPLLAVVVALLAPRIVRAGPDLRFELLAHDTPPVLCQGEGHPVRVTLRNDGRDTWSTQRGDRISYVWLDDDDEPLTPRARRTELPHDVVAGQSVEVDAVLEAPPIAGAHRLRWALVREKVGWSSSKPDPVTVEVSSDSSPALAWAIEGFDAASLGQEGLGANGTAHVEVTLRNTGCAAWSPELGDALSYHWLTPEGEPLHWEGVRTPMPVVVPGARTTVRARLVAPPLPGPARLSWEPVREHVAWYGAPTQGERELELEIGPPDLGWSLTHGGQPPALHADEVVSVEVGLRNDGVLAWRHEDGDRLSYRWERVDEEGEPVEGLRTKLDAAVAPGETTVLVARLQAPAEPGRYRLRWEPVREHVTWYGPPIAGDAPRTIEVDVGAPLLSWSLERMSTPRGAWASRTRTVRVLLRNTGADTWSPERGDRLSYRWLDEDGDIIVRDGLRTVLPHEVGPGETVTLDMRLRSPDAPGRYVLAVEMLREHVRWYGPPKEGRPSAELRVVRWSSVLGLGFVAWASLMVLVHVRRIGPPPWRAATAPLVVPLGLAAAVFVLVETFFDHARVDVWAGARGWALSGAFVWGLVLFALPVALRRWAALAIIVGLSALVVADLAYVRFFGSIVPLQALKAAHQLGDASTTVSSLLEPAHLWFLPATVGVAVLAILGPRPAAAGSSRARRVIVSCFVLASAPAVAKLGHATFGTLGTRVFSEVHNAGRFGVVNAHLFQLGRALRALAGRSVLSEEARREIDAFLVERPETSEAAMFGSARGANLVVLQVEALQDWVVDARVDGRPVMPFLAGASDEALRMTQVFDQTAQGRTSDAEYLVLASGHALAEGALCFLRADAKFHTWAHALAEQGYATLSAHPYKRGFWNRATIHPRYGFEKSLFRRELGEGPMVGWGLADGPFLERMAERLDGERRPFAGFLITLSLHHPYDAFPASLKSLDVGDLEGTRLGNYLQAMHYFDRALQAFVEDLRTRGLLDQTVLLVFGDHVAQLEETPRMLELAGVEAWSPAVPARLHKVGTFLWAPGGPTGRVDRVGGQIDLGATALHLLGVPPPQSFLGRPLVEPGRGFVALPDGSAVSGDRMFVARGRDIGRDGACFDHPRGGARPLRDCRDLADRAALELRVSRRILDHDLFRELDRP
jgi:phosphoglycerol transferase MdoB-like AlkP superfamily enzyme